MHKSFKFPLFRHKIKEPPVLLFVQYFTDMQKYRNPLHAHDFWQLEVIAAGSVVVKSGASSLNASEGACVLIPKGIPHRFIYNGSHKREIWSVKFKLEMDSAPRSLCLLEKDEYSEHVLKEILNILSSEFFDGQRRLSLSWLLGLFLEMSFKINSNAPQKPDVIEKIKMRIDEYEGRRVTVEDIAELLQVSRNTLSKLFHDETGIQLKTYIDTRRMEIAKEILTYSKMTVSEIARVMEFPDIYAFSKFFSRVAGLSPKNFRSSMKKNAEQAGGKRQNGL